MTKLRALHGALACGAILAIGGTAHADVANYTINPGSSQSNVDNSCVGALPGFTGEDCSYNAIDLWGTAAWVGPVKASTYYANGTSPFETAAPGTSPLPEAPVPDPNNVSLAVSGTLAIDDVNGTSCDGDDTISARIGIAAGTRTFSGGPGTWAEESWGDNTIVYEFTDALPDTQTLIAEGCEYIFASQGFPPLLDTQGLSPAGIQTFPVDLAIGSDPIDPADGEQDAWNTDNNGGIGVGSFEGTNFQGNVGVSVSIDQSLLEAGTWQCVDNFGDPANPPVPSACNFTPAADGTPCDNAGSHFCAARAVQENWIMRIVVDAAGDIVEPALIFANNESIVVETIPPAPDANNSWDGPLITFTATCDDCSVAKSDNYTFVTGASATVSLPIGANDDASGQLDNANTLLTIDAPGPTRGTCLLTGANPGDVTGIGCDYTSSDNFASAGTDTFTYTLDDGILGPEFGLQATVTIDVEADAAPVANDYPIDFDTQGVDPATLRNTTDVLDDVNGNAGGNNPTVTIQTQATSGTAEVVGAEITYTANADFFQGTDSYQYTISDDNFNSPGVAPESQTATATVTIPNVVPTASDVDAEVEAGESIDIAAIITAGNGTVDQHTVTSDCDNGDLTVNSVGVNGAAVQVNATYAAPEGFEGEDVCTYTVTDENGAGDAADGTVTITVTASGLVIKLPGAGSALSPVSLLLLPFAPLLRRRRQRQRQTRIISGPAVTKFAWLAICGVALLGGANAVNAATSTLKLQNVLSFSNAAPDGSSPVIEANGDDWIYDDVAQTVSNGTEFQARTEVGLFWLFTQRYVGGVLPVSGPSGIASGDEYECIEGNFGNIVARALLCGNSNYGANNTNESFVTYGPGTDFAKFLNTDPVTFLPNGGDDEDLGAMQSINQLDGFDIVSWDQVTLVISNKETDPSVSGFEYTFAAVGEANDDTYAVAQNEPPVALDIGDNDRHWPSNSTVVDDASGLAQGTGTDGGTFAINSDPDVTNVTATYTPINAGYTGTETWTYRVTDTSGPLVGQSDTAAVTVTVNPPGTANDDSGDTVTLTTPVEIPIGNNDVGFADPSTATVTVAAAQGDVTINNSPGSTAGITATYTSTAPLGSAAYQDTFTYEMTDGNATGTAVVTVNVNNLVPVANDLADVTLDTQGVSPSDVSVDIDVGPGGDIAGNALGDVPSVVTAAAANDVTTAVNGTVITITASAFASAGDAVGYTITDVDTEADTGTIAVSIPDVSPTVGSVSETIAFAGPFTVTMPFTAGNGAISDHTLNISQPQFGTIDNVVVDVGVITFDYTPGGFSGPDVITVSLTDGDGSVGTGTATLTMTGSAVTIPPQDSLPGSSSSLSPATLGLLLSIPLLLRGRRRKRED